MPRRRKRPPSIGTCQHGDGHPSFRLKPSWHTGGGFDTSIGSGT
ncbi:hypothetical protein NJ7G_3636 [Natrinema sp. J7-2]|nr:hypothetical protein NJ7G_3636 [Natrinema sp. J7-2]